MQKLPPVEEAKTLFADAKHWSMWRWLTEKGRARATADAAWAALEVYEGSVRTGWPSEVKKAWRASRNGNSELSEAIQKLKEADEAASQARIDAEAQFDEADRRMSTSMACEGAQMAIDAWGMREKVIRKAESLGKRFEA